MPQMASAVVFQQPASQSMAPCAATRPEAITERVRQVFDLVRRTIDESEPIITWQWSGGKARAHSAHILAEVVAVVSEVRHVRIARMVPAVDVPEGMKAREIAKLPHVEHPFDLFTGYESDVACAIYLMDLIFSRIEVLWEHDRSAMAGTPMDRGKRTMLRETKTREAALVILQQVSALADSMRLSASPDARQIALAKRLYLADRAEAA